MNRKLKKKLRFCVIRRGDVDNLQISLDYGSNPDKLFPVFLYTPYMPDVGKRGKNGEVHNDHYHIPLTKAQAKKLYEWLKIYVEGRDNVKSELVKCPRCGRMVKEVAHGIDPFMQDVYNEEVYMTACEDCFEERASEV